MSIIHIYNCKRQHREEVKRYGEKHRERKIVDRRRLCVGVNDLILLCNCLFGSMFFDTQHSDLFFLILIVSKSIELDQIK